MKRTPVYHEKNSDFRICSMGNDLWQYQYCQKSRQATREHDPWQEIMRPASYQTAKVQLETLNCPHCHTSLDAPEEGCFRWGLAFGHPFTSNMELMVCKGGSGPDRWDVKFYRCRECGGEWKDNLRAKAAS